MHPFTTLQCACHYTPTMCHSTFGYQCSYTYTVCASYPDLLQAYMVRVFSISGRVVETLTCEEMHFPVQCDYHAFSSSSTRWTQSIHQCIHMSVQCTFVCLTNIYHSIQEDLLWTCSTCSSNPTFPLWIVIRATCNSKHRPTMCTWT